MACEEPGITYYCAIREGGKRKKTKKILNAENSNPERDLAYTYFHDGAVEFGLCCTHHPNDLVTLNRGLHRWEEMTSQTGPAEQGRAGQSGAAQLFFFFLPGPLHHMAKSQETWALTGHASSQTLCACRSPLNVTWPDFLVCPARVSSPGRPWSIKLDTYCICRGQASERDDDDEAGD